MKLRNRYCTIFVEHAPYKNWREPELQSSKKYTFILAEKLQIKSDEVG